MLGALWSTRRGSIFAGTMGDTFSNKTTLGEKQKSFPPKSLFIHPAFSGGSRGCGPWRERGGDADERKVTFFN